mgnify:CR=1 FL=1
MAQTKYSLAQSFWQKHCPLSVRRSIEKKSEPSISSIASSISVAWQTEKKRSAQNGSVANKMAIVKKVLKEVMAFIDSDDSAVQNVLPNDGTLSIPNKIIATLQQNVDNIDIGDSPANGNVDDDDEARSQDDVMDANSDDECDNEDDDDDDDLDEFIEPDTESESEESDEEENDGTDNEDAYVESDVADSDSDATEADTDSESDEEDDADDHAELKSSLLLME